MSDAWIIAITSLSTIFGGIIVYTMGHIIVVFFVEPIHRLRSTIGEIADSLIFYSANYANPNPNVDSLEYEKCLECEKIMGRHSSQLRARALSIPAYSFWSLIKWVPKRSKIIEAAGELTLLSHSIFSSLRNSAENINTAETIKKLLSIPTK